MLLASSTVMTPSLPTFSIASAMILPIVSSLLAEMVPTWAMAWPLTGLACFFSSATIDFDGLLDAALELHRVGAGDDVLRALAEDRLREDGRRGRAVTRDVGRLAGDLADHLGAHVLERVLQVDFLRDGDAVLGDRGGAELLVEDDVAALRAERHLDRVGEGIDAAQDGLSRLLTVNNLLCHDCRSLQLRADFELSCAQALMSTRTARADDPPGA